MHEQHVAHRYEIYSRLPDVSLRLSSDCMNLNIMMNPIGMYPHPYHPCRPSRRLDTKGWARHRPRTECPPRYLFIDFGISRRYQASERAPLEPPIWGGYKNVPEFQLSNEPRNPFPTDVWYLGLALQQRLLNVRISFNLVSTILMSSRFIVAWILLCLWFRTWYKMILQSDRPWMRLCLALC
jgi:hypothetical protein